MTLGSKQQCSETGKKYQMNDFLLQASCESPSAGLVTSLGDLLLETGIRHSWDCSGSYKVLSILNPIKKCID